MKVAVIGAGIAGITTAYELAQQGLKVTVFERNAAVAEGGSFANAGIVAPSLAHPLSHPLWPGGTWTRKFSAASGVSLAAGLHWGDYHWRMQWQSATEGAFLKNATLAHQLVKQGQGLLQGLCKGLGSVVEQSPGQMILLKSEKMAKTWKAKLELLDQLQVPFRVLTPAAARKMENGISASLELHSALYFENDESINCRQFAQLLKDEALRIGVNFRFSAAVQSIAPGASVTLQTEAAQPFDAVILCCAQEAATLLKPLGTRLPLAAVYGHSVSGHIKEPLNAPHCAVLDGESGVSMVRMGTRVRVSGGAELGHAQQSINNKTLDGLYRTLQETFPGATQFQGGAHIWRGCSVFSPDGLPLLGPTNVPGIWLNTGHGMQGVGMAAACARLLTEMQLQQPSQWDIAALRPLRFGKI